VGEKQEGMRNAFFYRFLPKSRSKFCSQHNEMLPAVITLRHTHNHAKHSAAALKHRDMSDNTRQKLIELFHRGHSPSSALHCIKTELMIATPDDYHVLSADSSIVPSNAVVSHLYRAEFSREYGALSGDKLIDGLKTFVDKFNASVDDECCKFGQVEDNYFVSVCTPLMARVHDLVPQTAEIMPVDASGGMDRQKHRVYMFITLTNQDPSAIAQKFDKLLSAEHCAENSRLREYLSSLWDSRSEWAACFRGSSSEG